MSQYYLMAQLPSLDALAESTPLPINEERFSELCNRFLDQKMIKILSGLTLLPNKTRDKSGSALVDAWNNGERQLRFALSYVRAEKMGKETEHKGADFPSELLAAVRQASEDSDPLNAEKQLLKYRLDFLESIRPADIFSDEAVYYYGLRLKLISRMRTFDTSAGKAAYQTVYNSILHGETQEAM